MCTISSFAFHPHLYLFHQCTNSGGFGPLLFPQSLAIWPLPFSPCLAAIRLIDYGPVLSPCHSGLIWEHSNGRSFFWHFTDVLTPATHLLLLPWSLWVCYVFVDPGVDWSYMILHLLSLVLILGLHTWNIIKQW